MAKKSKMADIKLGAVMGTAVTPQPVMLFTCNLREYYMRYRPSHIPNMNLFLQETMELQ